MTDQNRLWSCLPWLVLSVCAATAAGCSLTLDLQSGPRLNMRARPGVQDPGQQVSELLEVAVLQLKKVPEERQRDLLNKLEAEWPTHRSQMSTYVDKGNFPEVLASFLAYPATLLDLKRPREIFVLNPGQRYSQDVPIRASTSHLLVMTLGSKKSMRSVQLFDVGLTTGTVSLCFVHYDVHRADGNKPWLCPQAPLAQ